MRALLIENSKEKVSYDGKMFNNEDDNFHRN